MKSFKIIKKGEELIIKYKKNLKKSIPGVFIYFSVLFIILVPTILELIFNNHFYLFPGILSIVIILFGAYKFSKYLLGGLKIKNSNLYYSNLFGLWEAFKPIEKVLLDQMYEVNKQGKKLYLSKIILLFRDDSELIIQESPTIPDYKEFLKLHEEFRSICQIISEKLDVWFLESNALLNIQSDQRKSI